MREVITSRRINLSLAILLLGLMCFYADQKADVIYSLPYDNTKDYIALDGKRILAISGTSFTVPWQNGSLRNFGINVPPPFKVGDRISFKLKPLDGHYRLVEYHVWESKSRWLMKATVSIAPMLIIIFIFLRDYRFSFPRMTFVQRKLPDA